MTLDPNKTYWWAYLHSNGTLQLKRWFGDVKDYTEDCDKNPFVVLVVEPFEAASREFALVIANQKVLDKQMSNSKALMKWYYKSIGTHTSVRIYCRGAFCGKLTFRNEEFTEIRATLPERQGIDSAVPLIHFVDDNDHQDATAV